MVIPDDACIDVIGLCDQVRIIISIILNRSFENIPGITEKAAILTSRFRFIIEAFYGTGGFNRVSGGGLKGTLIIKCDYSPISTESLLSCLSQDSFSITGSSTLALTIFPVREEV